MDSRWAPAGCSPTASEIPARLVRRGTNRLLVRVATPLMPALARWDSYPMREELLDPPPRQVLAAWERDRAWRPWPSSGLGGPVRLMVY